MQQESLPLNQGQVSKLTVGMGKDALDHLLADKTAKYTFTKQYEGVDYQVSVYDLIVGTESVLDMNC